MTTVKVDKKRERNSDIQKPRAFFYTERTGPCECTFGRHHQIKNTKLKINHRKCFQGKWEKQKHGSWLLPFIRARGNIVLLCFTMIEWRDRV